MWMVSKSIIKRVDWTVTQQGRKEGGWGEGDRSRPTWHEPLTSALHSAHIQYSTWMCKQKIKHEYTWMNTTLQLKVNIGGLGLVWTSHWSEVQWENVHTDTDTHRYLCIIYYDPLETLTANFQCKLAVSTLNMSEMPLLMQILWNQPLAAEISWKVVRVWTGILIIKELHCWSKRLGLQ